MNEGMNKSLVDLIKSLHMNKDVSVVLRDYNEESSQSELIRVSVEHYYHQNRHETDRKRD